MTVVIGYTRVSTREQADSALGLRAQRSVIQAEADRRGWTVVWKTDTQSGRDLRRTELQEAFELLRQGTATVLVVAKLDRLSRSVQDFAETMARALKEGWEISALDLAIDTSTASGRLVAHVLAAVAEWERDVIGQRTKDALQERKLQGIRLGREAQVSPETVAIILTLARTRKPNAIARELALRGVQTPSGTGKRWYGSTVSRILARETA